MSTERHLSELQFAVMRVLWKRGEATVADVHGTLFEARGLAPTTISTVLSRLEKRGLLSHRSAGRQFIYTALVTEAEVRQSMVVELTELLFAGDPAELVSHLISEREFSLDELDRLRAAIEEQSQDGSGGDGLA